MKLHVNRPNTKKAEEQRKKKEQESTEAMSGLKIEDGFFLPIFRSITTKRKRIQKFKV